MNDKTTQYRLGFRAEDYRVPLSGDDPALIDTMIRIHRPDGSYVVLQHADTGEAYARRLYDLQLVRAFQIL